jgi:hypothetical protein
MSFKAWISRHPLLTAWAALAVGMVVILIWAARDVGLLPGQWAALIVATILLAGLCVWIIGWEKEEEDEKSGQVEAPPQPDQTSEEGKPQGPGDPAATP